MKTSYPETNTTFCNIVDLKHKLCDILEYDPMVKTRKRPHVTKRQVMAYVIGRMMKDKVPGFEGASWVMISAAFGYDHATAIYSYHTIDFFRTYIPEVQKMIATVNEKLGIAV